MLKYIKFLPILFLFLLHPKPVYSSTTVALPLHINAGSSTPYITTAGTLYQADQTWSTDNQWGHMDGNYKNYATHPTMGTEEIPLYETQLHNWSEYRIAGIPNGMYVVTLHFIERYDFVDVAQFALTVEDVHLSQPVDLWEQVGLDYVLKRRARVTVSDGTLNIMVTSIQGLPHLAALDVEPYTPTDTPPPAPAQLTVSQGYEEILLNWADISTNHILGYHVYRALSPSGPFERITSHLLFVSRYRDQTALPEQSYAYQVRAVSVQGQVGTPATTSQTYTPLRISDSTLPFYDLTVADSDLALLYDAPHIDRDVPATLQLDGVTYSVEIRFRGWSTIPYQKKSWKIIFKDASPFASDRINLNSDYGDWTLLRARLSQLQYEIVGIEPPTLTPALVRVNGEFQGIFAQLEQIDKDFLTRTGRNRDATIYKSVLDLHVLLAHLDSYKIRYEQQTNEYTSHEDIQTFTEMIHLTTDDEFPYYLTDALNVRRYLRSYAVHILTSQTDFTFHNTYLIHDLFEDSWEILPWDWDRSWGIYGEWQQNYYAEFPIDMGTAGSSVSLRGGNPLLTRMMSVDRYRQYYCYELDRMLHTTFTEAALFPQIQSLHNEIAPDAVRDWYKFQSDDNRWFEDSVAGLQTYVRERRQSLLEQMPAYCPDLNQPFLEINELMIRNETFCDPADTSGSCYDPWLEIHNEGLLSVNLQGMYLTDDLSNPTKYLIDQPLPIAPLGYAHFWADNESDQGVQHLSFRLNLAGGLVALFDRDGRTLLDRFDYGAYPNDISVGRYPNGTESKRLFQVPTPDNKNTLRAPRINDVVQTPRIPTEVQSVQIAANVLDDSEFTTPRLHYMIDDGSFVSMPMTWVVGDQYQAVLPAYPDQTRVQYYIRTEDDDELETTSPHNAPDATYEYIVNYHPQTLYINEFMAKNDTGLVDPNERDETPDWIELYNPTEHIIMLEGMYLSDELAVPKHQLDQELAIPPNGYVLFYADDDPDDSIYNLRFKLAASGGAVAVFDGATSHYQRLDGVSYVSQTADISRGRCPDGLGSWLNFTLPTPRTANDCSHVMVGHLADIFVGNQMPAFESGFPVYLNEVMPRNRYYLPDPMETTEYPDWFELYNSSSTPVNLSGLYLTNDRTKPTQYQIPSGVVIPAHGYLLFYADDDAEQGATHTNFKLTAEYGDVALFASDGSTLLDVVRFRNVPRDTSYGRDEDGTWNLQLCASPNRVNDCLNLYMPLLISQ